MADDAKTCPSARCNPGASLLGVLGSDGRIKHARTAMTIDADFVARAQAHGPPEARFRFASPCVEGKCEQWSGNACGVVEKVLAHIEAVAPELARDDLPPCTIRQTCRWYSQSGEKACKVCDLVVTGQNMTAAE
jgi:hypothetical protein